MDRTLKAVAMGLGLLASVYVAVLVARMVWFLAILMLPFLIAFAALYFLGYGAPSLGGYGRRVHKSAEAKARAFLDWLDFTTPPWVWPAIRTARTFLDWLGLQVA